MHLVLKSDAAKGELSFVNFKSKIERLISISAKACGVRVLDTAINFNHIHLVISVKFPESYKKWIRLVTAEIVRLLSRETKTILKGFFTHRPYTRILSWGRELRVVFAYLVLNKMEVVGLRPQSGKKKKRFEESYSM